MKSGLYLIDILSLSLQLDLYSYQTSFEFWPLISVTTSLSSAPLIIVVAFFIMCCVLLFILAVWGLLRLAVVLLMPPSFPSLIVVLRILN